VTMGSGRRGHRAAIADAVAYCGASRHLRRTVSTALLVGVVLTAINQSSALAHGHVGAATWVRCALNFAVPFVVSNVGLLSGRAAMTVPFAGG